MSVLACDNVQRVFERRSIDLLARGLVNRLKRTGDKLQLARKDAFIKLIVNVVRILKATGYSVEVSKENQLEVLWADCLKGGWSSER